MARKKRGRLFTLIIGGIAGAIGGLLLAPRAGKETREQLKAKMDEMMEEGREKYGDQQGRIFDMASERSRELRSRIEEARERLVSGVDTATEKIKEKIGTEAEKAEEKVTVVEKKIEEAKEGPKAVKHAEEPEAPVEEAPTEEVSVEEAPVEEAPVEEKPEEEK